MTLPMASPTKDPRTGVYQFRKRVPAHLVAVAGRKEVTRTLRTKDPKEARIRFREVEREVQAEWDLLLKKPEPLPWVEIVALSGVIYRDLVLSMASNPGEPSIWEAAINRCAFEVERGNAEGWFGKSVDRVLRERSIKTDEVSRQKLIEETGKAIIQAAEQLKRNAEGDYRPDPKAERFPPLVPVRRPAKVSFMTLVDAWKEGHRRRKGAESTIRRWEPVFATFVGYLGDDLAGISSDDVRRWRDWLIGEKKLKLNTVRNSHLAAVRAVLKRAKGEGQIVSDPTEGVKVDIEKKVVTRESGLSDSEAALILQAAINQSAPGNRAEAFRFSARRWVPWLLAYSGARVTEITQMHKEHVVVDRGVHCLKITPEAGSVKTGEFRLVPIHSHLIEQGFLEWVRAAEAGPLFYDAKATRKGKQTTQADSLSKSLGRWVRTAVKITDDRVDPNHGWRHRFKTVAIEAGVPPSLANAIQGHKDSNEGAKYGDRTPVALRREIEKLPRYEVVEGLDLRYG